LPDPATTQQNKHFKTNKHKQKQTTRTKQELTRKNKQRQTNNKQKQTINTNQNILKLASPFSKLNKCKNKNSLKQTNILKKQQETKTRTNNQN